ncbi:PREDICTED: uncharacterized protein LOC109353287 isoform X1 [Lupinus angustifolius]|uniref:uncharacterized protein LOC109353287 isoform X1 n=2 Tax=Lupinus angustifolius TaxID=3871 RepID=UPI00092E5DD9|nr:PREDICTED: uncharacterized protein LOC109353287 isoform X1 [Lupinus angustifolius]
MAAINCFSLFSPSHNSFTRQRRNHNHSFIIVSSFSSSKLTLRKNHLRPKILKTLIPKPYLVNIPATDEESVQFEDVQESEATNDYNSEFEDLRVSEANSECNGEIEEDLQVCVSEPTTQKSGFSSSSFSAINLFKYGAIYMLGGFVFHSIFNLWFFFYRYSNFNQNDGDLEIDGNENSNLTFNSNHNDVNLGIDGREKRNLLFNGNGKSMVVNAATATNLDKLEMEKKIKQIKLMAREARRAEEMKKEQGEVEDPESDDESPLSSSQRLGIEREIGARLSKLQDRINNDGDKSAALQIINSLGSSAKYAAGVARDGKKNVNRGKEALTFKKKLTFKSPSTKLTKTPKGFVGTRDRRGSSGKKKGSAGSVAAQDYGSDATDGARILYDDKQVNQQGVETHESVSRLPLERKKIVDDKSNAILNQGKKLEDKTETPSIKTGSADKTKNTNNGGFEEASFPKSAPEVIQLRELSTQNSLGSVEENQETSPIFEKGDVHGINGSSRHGLAEKTSAANRDKVKQENAKTDIWWLNLRYVLVIFMERDSNGGQKALYTLKLTSTEQDQGVDSYIVAFEDHGDANNFCVLLETYFEDLDDFSASPVPMTIQELNEEIASHANKVVVVKKRQIQLYAGQPFTDVEMALHSVIEQDQNVP